MKKHLLLFSIILFSSSLLAQFGYPTRISNDTQKFPSPNKIVAADMDNDGDIDFVVSPKSQPTVVWFENLDGQGSYGNPIEVGTKEFGAGTSGIDDIQVADINNDGDLDVIVLRNEAVYWFQNEVKHTATFSSPIDLPILPGLGNQLAVGDINGDNNLDILVVEGGYNSGDKNLGWYQSIGGTGAFEDFVTITEDARNVVILEDMDADGDLDIFTASLIPNTFWHSFSMLENLDGAGNFSSLIVLKDTINIPYEVMLEDLDTDGDLDLIVYDKDSEVYWHKNLDGEGNMGYAQHLSSEYDYGVGPPSVYDFDSDGNLDIVITNGQFSRIYKNTNGQGDFNSYQEIFVPYRTPTDIITTDVNSDGFQDIITINESNMNREAGFILKQKDNGLFSPPIDFIGDTGSFADDYNSGLISSPDLDGDGIPELIVGSNYYGKAGWQKFENTPLKFNNPSLLPFNMEHFNGLDYGDMDGDGDLDIVATYAPYNGNDRVGWFERNSDGEINFDHRHDLHIGGYIGSKQVSAIDMDEDGDLDVLANFDYNAGSTNERGVFYLENLDGLGNFAAGVKIVSNTSRYALFKDLDGDGDTDVLSVVYSAPNSNIGWTINDNGSYGTFVELLVDLPVLNRAYFEDMDNDGLGDIVYKSENTLFWHKNEGGTFSTVQTYYQSSGVVKDLFFTESQSGNFKDFYLLTDAEVLFFENSGQPNELALPLWISNNNEASTHLYLADFDNDKDLDLITYSSPEQSMFFQENYNNLPTVTGKVYFDENENANYDLGEFQLYLQLVEIQPEAYATFSSLNGNFNFAVNNGIYDVKCTPSSNFSLTSPQTVNVEVSEDADAEVFFGLKPNTLELDATIEMISGVTRCGFEVPFWIDYHNAGTVVGDALIYVELDPLVTFLNSNPAPDSIVNNFVYWSHENLPPTHSGQIQMTLQMPGVEYLGEWISMTTYNQMTSNDGSMTALGTSGYRSEINCAVDPNDKQVWPNIPDNDNYTLFGETLKYAVRFQNTGTDTAFTVRIEDFLDDNLDWSSLEALGTSHPYEVTLDQVTGRMIFTFENILLPDSTTNEVASHGFIHYQIQHKNGLPERTIIQNTAGIYFDFNPPVITNTVENILVSQYPLLFEIDEPTCSGDGDGSINVIFDLPLFETYQWNTGATNSSIDSLFAGSYHLVITTSDGAQIDTTIMINDPLPLNTSNYGVFDISCFGLEDGKIIIQPNGGVPNYFYEWSNGNTTAQNKDLPAGEYLVTISDANGCIAKDSFILVSPPELIINAEVNMATCYDGSDGSIDPYIQGGMPGYYYLWNTGSSQEDLTQLTIGTYTLTVTDDNGCTQEKSMEVGAPPEIILNTTATFVTAQNMDGIAAVQAMGGVQPYSYEWAHDITQTDSVVNNLGVGDYTVTVTDANNCTQIAIISVEHLTAIKDLASEVYFKVSPNPGLGDINIELEFESIQKWNVQIFNVTGQSIKKFESPSIGNKGDNLKFHLPSGNYHISLFVENELIKNQSIIVQK